MRHGKSRLVISSCAIIATTILIAIRSIPNDMPKVNYDTMEARMMENEEREVKHLLDDNYSDSDTTYNGTCSYDWQIPQIFGAKHNAVYLNSHPISKRALKGFKPRLLYTDTKHKFNNNLYLSTSLLRGPNNQLRELRQVMALAIILNRTLVIPRFIPHRTSMDIETKFIHPLHRVDFSKACKLIPCIYFDDFKRFCNNRIDLLFQLPGNKDILANAGKFKEMFQMDVIEDDRFTVLSYATNLRNTKNVMKVDQIKRAFRSEISCGVVPLYYSNPIVRDEEYLAIMDEVERATPLPQYIQKISQDFIIDVMKTNNFASVHWRYDYEDFQKRCYDNRLDKIPEGYLKFCNVLQHITAESLAGAIYSFTRNPNTTFKGDTIYIASPPSEKEKIGEVTKILQRKGMAIFTASHLHTYIQHKAIRDQCPFINHNYDDIISNVELSICAKGKSFLRSSQSSWSDSVNILRKHIGLKQEGTGTKGPSVLQGIFTWLQEQNDSLSTNGFQGFKFQ